MTETAPPEVSIPPVSHLQGWAALLEWFYLKAGLDVPRLDQLKGIEVLQPYKSLLVHSSDMTPTLESHFRQPLGLTVLSRELQGDSYLREVVLTLGDGGRRILYGVIRIFLRNLPPMARYRVLEERFPLGHILYSEGVPHLSWPQAFFRAEPDSHMTAMLALPRPRRLFGRRNVLLSRSRRLIADVIEVLAPIDERGVEERQNPEAQT